MVAYEAWAVDILRRINEDNASRGKPPAKNHWQDTRSMSVYLSFMYPEAHYLYKAGMYIDAAKYLGVSWPGNKFDKVITYREMCEQILVHLKETRPDIIEASDATLGDLTKFDPSYHMLVQDIVYFIHYHDKNHHSKESGDGADESPSVEEREPEVGADCGDVEKLNVHVASSDNQNAESGHWLLVANAKIWSFFNLKVGAKTSYTIYNEKGNPRRVHKNYLAAKPSDPIIGYESSPTRRVVSICEITREHDDERLYFHKVCNVESKLTFEQIKSDPILSKCEFSKNPNGSFFALTSEEYARFVELLGLEGQGGEEDDNPIAPVDDPDELAPYTDADFLSEVFVKADDLADMRALLERKKNLILQGSPGTGKTFCAKRLAWTIMGCRDDSRVTFMQFHQSTTYDDFVCGFRPDGNGGFTVKDGPFIRACREAARDHERPHFVIIDEINRAYISKVLGELLMLIEADHREVDSVLLTVSGERLTVPKNLYIIGMMNTADRGLALIDYALRRRFAFFEMTPALEHPRFLERVRGNGDPHLEALIEATKEVNKDIAADVALGDGFRIGHSYFCDAKDAWLELRYELAPLVREYWFDDPKKVRKVLDKLEKAFE